MFRFLSVGLAPFIRLVEDSLYGKIKGAHSIAPPIFIIGAPRTGSTILYQALTNAYDLNYIDNTACRWHRNLRFGMWLSHRKYGNAPHNNFKADHGNTSKFGGHAPSECGGFWYRWLSSGQHFIDHHEITERMVKGLRSEVLGVSAYFNKPLLFKNLNAGQRLRLINRAFPGAKIIFIRRDPRFVVRSILKARARVGVKSHEWWSIMPPNVEELTSLPESQMCTAQVYHIERQIDEDLRLFAAENVKEIRYQELDEGLLEGIAQWLGVSRKAEGELPEFHKDVLNAMDDEELLSLDRLVSQFPFKKDLFI